MNLKMSISTVPVLIASLRFIYTTAKATSLPDGFIENLV